MRLLIKFVRYLVEMCSSCTSVRVSPALLMWSSCFWLRRKLDCPIYIATSTDTTDTSMRYSSATRDPPLLVVSVAQQLQLAL